MSNNLQIALDAVEDEGTFINFLQALAEDREDEVNKEKKSPLVLTAQVQMVGKMAAFSYF